MIITFKQVDEFEGWHKFPAFIEEVIARNSAKRVCEIGAGANPAISEDVIRKYGLTFRAADQVEEELLKSEMVETAVYDVCATDPVPGAPYDLIFSRMTAEHFRDPERAYANMFEALAPSGLAVHSFATLYALPFVLNRVLPDRVTDFLFDRFAPRNRERHDKFKAYYSHCRGPMESQLQFFRNLGYDIVEYRAYFGHNYYEPRLPLLHQVIRQTSKLLLKAPIAFFVSYATIILRRPALTEGLRRTDSQMQIPQMQS
jgi:SAM-dependent methyltransferase